MGKILQPLTKSGIVGSKTGAFGGFYLAKPASEIVLFDIVIIFEGPDYFKNCVLGFPGCDDKTPCPVHKKFLPILDQIVELFNNQTIAELAKDIKRGEKIEI